MDKKTFFQAYRSSLFEGFNSGKNSPSISAKRLEDLKSTLDTLEPRYLKGEISVEDIVSKVKNSIENQQGNIAPMNVSRDACILLWIAIGAAILAAWVASGGTLIIGTVVAGVTISQPIMAAIVGGASAATIACMLGNCGDC
ncbi:hypothetical protein [Vibrio sp. ArtGut-C1]|uniref:hypothetical protein n=1 Tax=Vibrio sp. ArtGut-C1 TaxID=2259137 RepID=UPI000A194CD6|nr:hypothetical protein [Vibrio sp. ArtGut-C1]